VPYVGGKLHLSYDVDGTASVATDVSVDGGEATLPAPSVDEEDGAVLPADTDTLTLRVPAWVGMAMGDLLMYTWKGTPPGGTAVTLSDGMHVPAHRVGKDIPFTLDPLKAVAPFNGGMVEAWYQVTPAAGGAAETSLHGSWQVGTPALLPAPTVDEAVNGELSAGLASATVRVPAYVGMAAGDLVTITWTGDVTGKLSVSIPVSSTTAGGDITFRVPAAGIRDNASVEVSYVVDTVAGRRYQSDTLSLAVMAIPNLPAPRVKEAPGGILSTVIPSATVVVQAWPHMNVGDVVELHWTGDITGKYSAQHTVHYVNKKIIFQVDTSQVINNSQVTVSYSVVTEKEGTLFSEELRLVIREDNSLPLPEIYEAYDDIILLSNLRLGAEGRIPVDANLEVGDQVNLILTEPSGTMLQHHVTITATDVGKMLQVPLKTITEGGGNCKFSYRITKSDRRIQFSKEKIYFLDDRYVGITFKIEFDANLGSAVLTRLVIFENPGFDGFTKHNYILIKVNSISHGWFKKKLEIAPGLTIEEINKTILQLLPLPLDINKDHDHDDEYYEPGVFYLLTADTRNGHINYWSFVLPG